MGISIFLTILLSLQSTLGFMGGQPLIAALPPGNPITDASAILRNALPIKQKELQKAKETAKVTIVQTYFTNSLLTYVKVYIRACMQS